MVHSAKSLPLNNLSSTIELEKGGESFPFFMPMLLASNTEDGDNVSLSS